VPECPSGNLFDQITANAPDEEFRTLLARPGLRIERIVSNGQSNPPGFWYDQAWDEWVLLISGAAAIEFDDGGRAHTLRPGEYLHIAAGRRHRVGWTAEHEPTVWLAIHFGHSID
jgi:cupin 2 domain-containing protein